MELPLCLDLYGVQFRIDRVARTEPELLARLFAPFLRPVTPEFDLAIPLEFCARDRATDIVTLMNPGLSEAGMVVLHAAALVAEDGAVVLLLGGPGTGKSTSARRWMAGGGAVVGDDLVLLRQGIAGVDVRPYFYSLQGAPDPGSGEKAIEVVEPGKIRSGTLRGLVFLDGFMERTEMGLPISPAEALLGLSSQILWSPEPQVAARQKTLVEKALQVRRSRLHPGRDLLTDATILQTRWCDLIG